MLEKCGCGGEVRVVNNFGSESDFMVVCTGCGLKTAVYHSREMAVNAWNRAMSAKDMNVPGKFATDTNVGDKERTAKVENQLE